MIKRVDPIGSSNFIIRFTHAYKLLAIYWYTCEYALTGVCKCYACIVLVCHPSNGGKYKEAKTVHVGFVASIK